MLHQFYLYLFSAFIHHYSTVAHNRHEKKIFFFNNFLSGPDHIISGPDHMILCGPDQIYVVQTR